MESTDKNAADSSRLARPSFIRDEATLSAFRKRNKKLIIALLLLSITTLSTIGSMAFYLLRGDVYYNRQDSSIRAFCGHEGTTSQDVSKCKREYSSLITKNHDAIKNPDHVLNLSLRTASEELDAVITTWRPISGAYDDHSRNCSIALRAAKGEIDHCTETVSRLRSWELQEKQWVDVWNRTIAARDGLKSACLESSAGPPVSGQIRAKVSAAEMHLGYAEDYLTRYYQASILFSVEIDDGKGVIFVQDFGKGMVGLQFLFMFFLILSLFRT